MGIREGFRNAFHACLRHVKGDHNIAKPHQFCSRCLTLLFCGGGCPVCYADVVIP